MTNNITDRHTFANFIEQLHHDFQTNTDHWTNKDLGDFLEAMSRYAEDVDGHYKNTNQNINADIPSWRVFADIIMGAKVYE